MAQAKVRRRDRPAQGQEPQRRCIVTRRNGPQDDLIRFALGPGGAVVPDIRARLPGRGVWVTATRFHVEEAVHKRLFQRGFKTACETPDTLAQQVTDLLCERALSYLSLATKAGLVVQGFDKVAGAIAKGNIRVLIAASDGAEDGRAKLRQKARAAGLEPELIDLFACDQLSLALGRTNVIHAAMTKGPLSDYFLNETRRFQAFTQADDREDRVSPPPA